VGEHGGDLRVRKQEMRGREEVNVEHSTSNIEKEVRGQRIRT
jgi:hypothetical protein